MVIKRIGNSYSRLLSIILSIVIFTTFAPPCKALEIDKNDSQSSTLEYIPNLEAKAILRDGLREIQERGSLLIGISNPSNAPFYYKDEAGKWQGYDIEVASGIAKSLGVQPKFIQKDWTYNRLVELVSAGELDMSIGKLSTTYKRISEAIPVRYLQLHQSMLFNRISLDNIKNSGDLSSNLISSTFKIGAIKGSSHERWAQENFPSATIISVKNWNEAIEGLTEKRFDAIYRDSLETSRIVIRNPKDAIRFVPIIIDDLPDSKSLWINPEKEGLRAMADQYIIQNNGIVSDEYLLEKYRDFYRNEKE